MKHISFYRNLISYTKKIYVHCLLQLLLFFKSLSQQKAVHKQLVQNTTPKSVDQKNILETVNVHIELKDMTYNPRLNMVPYNNFIGNLKPFFVAKFCFERQLLSFLLIPMPQVFPSLNYLPYFVCPFLVSNTNF